MNNRNWTWLDDATEEQIEDPAINGEIQCLADRWNRIHNDLEYRRFTRDNDAFNEYLSDLEEDEVTATVAKQNMQEELLDAELSMLEQKLHERNARMSRPYEHWGEEERYVEYMENRYDYDG